jgi:organic radical activating enzyme
MITTGMNDWFARQPQTIISPFELNNEGNGQAVVLRYAGCNLRCPLCYAWRYAWFTQNGFRYSIQNSVQALKNIPKIVKKKIVWVRIQGGEPCLTFNRILNTITFAVESLNVIHKNNLNYFGTTRAIIQTNAITFSKLKDEEVNLILSHLQILNDLKDGKLVFEISLKSPSNSSYLTPQIKGYNVLLNQIIVPLWSQGFNNIAVYPIAGLGPSIDGNNLFIIPIDPSKLPDEIPLFHPSTWTHELQQLISDFVSNIVPNYNTFRDFIENPRTNGGRKLAIEELEPTSFQASWISGYASRYKEFNIDIVFVNKILRKLTTDIPSTPQWRSWYNSWTSRVLFGKNAKWSSVLNKIPPFKNPGKILSMVRQMNDYFYPSHPKEHYPYL